MRTIAVIGGGVTGVTTAYALARRGMHVTLFERHRYPAMETSFANGGQLSASHAEAWNHWSTVRKGVGWMLQHDAPLLLRPAPTWHKVSWLAQFVAAIPRYRENTVALARLAIEARAHLFAWAEQEAIDFDVRREGILHLYRDKASFARAGEVTRLLGQAGLVRRAVTPAEMRALEPTLTGNFHGGFYTDSDSSGDIHRFTTGLAVACVKRGVTLLCDREVLALEPGNHVALKVRHGDDIACHRFDGVVICAGTGSRALARMAGDRVDVYPVKGYSITVNLEDASSRAAAPTVSLVDDAVKLVASRFGPGRFRVAGTAEFAGFDRTIREERIRPLIDWVRHEFPGVRTESVVPWAGLRPMMPNLLPRVGKGRAPGVFYNTGHGHLGWTLAAATAAQVADLIAAAEPVSTFGPGTEVDTEVASAVAEPVSTFGQGTEVDTEVARAAAQLVSTFGPGTEVDTEVARTAAEPVSTFGPGTEVDTEAARAAAEPVSTSGPGTEVDTEVVRTAAEPVSTFGPGTEVDTEVDTEVARTAAEPVSTFGPGTEVDTEVDTEVARAAAQLVSTFGPGTEVGTEVAHAAAVKRAVSR